MLKIKKKLMSVIISLAVIICFCVSTAFSYGVYGIVNPIKVKIVDQGYETIIDTASKTVGDILKENGYIVNERDYTEPALGDFISKNQTIYIRRNRPVTVVADGNTIDTESAKPTSWEILLEQGIIPTENDTIIYNIIDEQTNHAKVVLKRITYSEETIIDSLDYPVKQIENTSMYRGDSKVITKGKPGKVERTYKTTFENQVAVNSKLVDEKIIEAPVEEVVEIGTMDPRTALTSKGETLRVKKVIQVTATAYDLSYASCGKRPGDRGYGITASGMKAAYGVIAVDPRVIPLHSKLYIEAADGSWTYGYAVAGDTGGAIKGNRIDLFFNSHSEAIQFGRRAAKVYILE